MKSLRLAGGACVLFMAVIYYLFSLRTGWLASSPSIDKPHATEEARPDKTLSSLTEFPLDIMTLSALPSRLFSGIPSLTIRPPGTRTPPSALTPTGIPNPSTTAIPATAWRQNGQVEVPVLLYHRIEDYLPPQRYIVTTTDFRQQMDILYKEGFQAITVRQLVDGLAGSVELPPRPVVITFDDGYMDVYRNAFPIMQDRGLVGVVLVIAGEIDRPHSLLIEHLVEMSAKGWEIGSHGLNHVDLTTAEVDLALEFGHSKWVLEQVLGLEVRTFAYPFGAANTQVRQDLLQFGYMAGLGLGTYIRHSSGSLDYISRREVQGNYDLLTFRLLLGLPDPITVSPGIPTSPVPPVRTPAP